MMAAASSYFSWLAWGLSVLTAVPLATIIATYGTAFALRTAGFPENPKWSTFLRVYIPLFAVTLGLLWYALPLVQGLMSALMLIYVPVLLVAVLLVVSATMSMAINASLGLSLPRETTVPKGFVVDWLLPPDRAEEVLVNILGRYPYWEEKYGFRKARVIFVTQSLGSILSYWSDWLLRRLKLLTLFTRS